MKSFKRLQGLNSHIGGNLKKWKSNVFARTMTTGSNPSTENYFNSGVYINPHYAKRYKGGEDAACLTSHLLCVADGVGGWAESGVDPAIYSKRLCSM